jgi:hypothetical protein
MQVKPEPLNEDLNRCLYWTRIVFVSDDEENKTQVLVCSSREYLYDFYKIADNNKLSQENIDDWLNSVIEKWSKLEEKIFNQDVHYDVYANTPEGEANGLHFLLKKIDKL